MVGIRSSCRAALAMALAGALLSPLPAGAAPIVVSASGVWNASVPVSTWTAPDATWAFSFVTDDHPALNGFWDTGFNPVFSSFEYRLAGTLVSTSPVIALNTYASLVVSFGSGTGFQLFGPALFSGPPSAPVIHPGAYVLTAQPDTVEPYFEIDSISLQALTGTVLDVRLAPSPVPEPAMLLLIGAGVAGFVHRRYRPTSR